MCSYGNLTFPLISTSLPLLRKVVTKILCKSRKRQKVHLNCWHTVACIPLPATPATLAFLVSLDDHQLLWHFHFARAVEKSCDRNSMQVKKKCTSTVGMPPPVYHCLQLQLLWHSYFIHFVIVCHVPVIPSAFTWHCLPQPRMLAVMGRAVVTEAPWISRLSAHETVCN